MKKKLILNKQTVSHLSKPAMSDAKGGETFFTCLCDPSVRDCPTCQYPTLEVICEDPNYTNAYPVNSCMCLSINPV